MSIYHYDLIRTSIACPEQYDVYSEDVQVGYLRLRFGAFTVRTPGLYGEIVYEAHVASDGIFDYEEREEYLHQAVHAIHKALHRSGPYQFSVMEPGPEMLF